MVLGVPRAFLGFWIEFLVERSGCVRAVNAVYGESPVILLERANARLGFASVDAVDAVPGRSEAEPRSVARLNTEWM